MRREDLMIDDAAPLVRMFGFDESENAKRVAYEDLSQSIRVEGKHGRVLQTRPVQSWNAMNYILALLSAADTNHSLESIYVQKRNSFPQLNDAEKQLGYDRKNCPVSRWMFDKVAASIMIPNIGNDLVHGRIGFKFDDNGIQIAFGMNVNVCSNFAIMGGQIMQTYKGNNSDGLSWESIEIKLKDWIQNLDQKMKVEMDLMERMQNRQITDPSVIDHVIGGLYRRAIDQAYGSKKNAPFDTAGMSNFVQNVIKTGYNPAKVADHEWNGANRIDNVWDLYNYGTAIMKPGIVDIADIQISSASYADYLFDEFEILKN